MKNFIPSSVQPNLLLKSSFVNSLTLASSSLSPTSPPATYQNSFIIWNPTPPTWDLQSFAHAECTLHSAHTHYIKIKHMHKHTLNTHFISILEKKSNMLPIKDFSTYSQILNTNIQNDGVDGGWGWYTPTHPLIFTKVLYRFSSCFLTFRFKILSFRSKIIRP